MSSVRSSSISRASSSGSWLFNNMSKNPVSRRFSGVNFSPRIVVIPKSEYEKIKSAAVVMSKEERLKQQAKIYQDSLEKQNEINREFAQKHETHDAAFVESPKDEDLEISREILREKLKQHRLEQEDEIKKTNEIIFEAKCLADREQQILDKKQRIKNAKKMEQELEQRVVKQQLELEKKRQELDECRKSSQKNLSKIMKKQIEEQIRAEGMGKKYRKEWEALEMQKKIEEFKLQKTKEQMEKIEKQQKLKEGLEECLAEKKILKNQFAEEEQKQLEYIRQQRLQREMQEESLQAEKQRKEKLRQIRSAHISSLFSIYQNRPKDKTAIRTRREQEQIDRAWRQRELEKMAKLAEDKERLRVAREKQIQEKLQNKEEIERRRQQEHAKIIEADKCALEDERNLAEKKHTERLKYMSEIRQQIIEKEEKAHLLRDERERNAKEYRRKIAEQEKLLQEMKMKKLQELRSLNIPEKFMKEVARKSKVPWDNLVK